MAALDPITAALSLGTSIIERVFPNPTDAANAKLELLKMQQAGDLAQLTSDTQLALAQADTNKVEAASNRLFVAGWRPFVGWTCGAAFAFKFIGGPGAFVLAQLIGHPVTLPIIDTTDLLPLLFGMLGLGGFRTIEKVKGVA